MRAFPMRVRRRALNTQRARIMAKAKKAAKRTSAKTIAKTTAKKRATPRRASAGRAGSKRSASRRAGAKTGLIGTSGMFDFIPSGWFKDVMGSQTSRVIMAEALVAAAGAAAAVLVASRTETGHRAGQALADSGALMKEAAVSAAAAARDVIGKGASDAIGAAAKSLMGAVEDTQQDVAEKAFRMVRDKGDQAHDMADEARRYRQREKPH